MARVTIEDCLNALNGHFKVAKVASLRARKLEFGSASELDREHDKNTVLALREVAEHKVDESILNEPLDEMIALSRYADNREPPPAEADEDKEKKAEVSVDKESTDTESTDKANVDEVSTDDKESASSESDESKESEESSPVSLAEQVESSDIGQEVADIEQYDDINEQDLPDPVDSPANNESDTAPATTQEESEDRVPTLEDHNTMIMDSQTDADDGNLFDKAPSDEEVKQNMLDSEEER